MALRADKRESILTGALEVFARDGYTRAGIDVIAKEAGVSTRTIYNHFGDKATLFQAVITASSDRVAAGHMSAIDNYLRKVTDLEDDLTDLGVAWCGTRSTSPTSLSSVRYRPTSTTFRPLPSTHGETPGRYACAGTSPIVSRSWTG